MAEGLSVKPVPSITWADVGGREAALIQRCARRDEDACAELVTEHQRMVYQLSLNRLGDHNEALDLSQEVFLRVFRTIQDPSAGSRPCAPGSPDRRQSGRNRQRWWRRRHRSAGLARRAHQDHGEFPAPATAGHRARARPEAPGGRLRSALERLPFRSADGAGASRDRRIELRRDRVFTRRRGRHRQIAARARARGPSRPIEGCMTTLLTCAAVRRRLQAFYDRELPVPGLIDIEAHLADCPPCMRDLREIRLVGDGLRLAAAPGPADDWTGLQPGVISRMRAEAHESWTARVRRALDDLHLVWIGLGATAATCVCAASVLSMISFASPERHDSLAAVMAVTTSPSELVSVRPDAHAAGRAAGNRLRDAGSRAHRRDGCCRLGRVTRGDASRGQAPERRAGRPHGVVPRRHAVARPRGRTAQFGGSPDRRQSRRRAARSRRRRAPVPGRSSTATVNLLSQGRPHDGQGQFRSLIASGPFDLGLRGRDVVHRVGGANDHASRALGVVQRDLELLPLRVGMPSFG